MIIAVVSMIRALGLRGSGRFHFRRRSFGRSRLGLGRLLFGDHFGELGEDCPAIFLAVLSIRRLPICASFPPTCALTV